TLSPAPVASVLPSDAQAATLKLMPGPSRVCSALPEPGSHSVSFGVPRPVNSGLPGNQVSGRSPAISKVRRSLGSAGSQYATAAWLAHTSCVLSGSQIRRDAWPAKVCSGLTQPASHSWTAPLPLAVAKRVPSGDQATALPALSSRWSNFPVSASQTRVLVLPPARRDLPSGAQASARATSVSGPNERTSRPASTSHSRADSCRQAHATVLPSGAQATA